MFYELGNSYEIGAYELGAGASLAPDEIELVRQLAVSAGDYELGAAATKVQAASQAVKGNQMLMNALPQGAPLGRPPMVVKQRDPDQARVLWLGFKSAAAIASAASANVSAQPQDVFSARKIVIPSTVAPNFEINDIRVGTASQLSSADPVPAEAFVPDGVAADVRFDTAQVSQNITFSVTNISGAPAIFRAAINGFVARL